MSLSNADIIREYGPFEGAAQIHGVTYDGSSVWIATGDRLTAFDPESGDVARNIDVPAHAGSAYDGTHLFQIAGALIQKIDPATGRVVGTIPSPGAGADSGMAWAEGSLWVGQYRDRKIHQIDPETGKILRSIDSTRFVTGVTFLDGDLWHGASDGEASELIRVDRGSGEAVERIAMPEGVFVSGLESDGADRFFCGGGGSGKVRVVRRPAKAAG